MNFEMYFFPKDITGLLIVVLLIAMAVLSFFFALRQYFRSVPNYLNRVEKWLSDTVFKGTSSELAKGFQPAATLTSEEKIDFYLARLFVFQKRQNLKKNENLSHLNITLAESHDAWRLSDQFRSWTNLYLEGANLYPLLGILGTFIPFVLSSGQDIETLTKGFSTAVITSVWGIGLGLFHSILVALTQPQIQKQLDMPAKIEKAIYEFHMLEAKEQ